jgi:hypothetical protein
MRRCFDDSFIDDEQRRCMVKKAKILVGMHPDQVRDDGDWACVCACLCVCVCVCVWVCVCES